jgi:hypothetical protein
MSKYRFLILWGFVIVGMIGIIAYMEAAVWNECRAQHSFMYCYNMVFR